MNPDFRRTHCFYIWGEIHENNNFIDMKSTINILKLCIDLSRAMTFLP